MPDPQARRARIERLNQLRVVALVLPALLLTGLIGLDYFVIRFLLPPGESHLVLIVVGVAGVVAFSVAIFSRITHLHMQVSEKTAELQSLTDILERRREQLQALNAAGLSLSADIASGAVLQNVVELARSVARARYAALGVFGDAGDVVQFLTAGISEEGRARIGPLPKGRGLLGLLQREQRPIRLRDLKDHPASVGFPLNHPPMHSFLGVPIRSRGRNLGNLYLTEKEDAEEFSADDEEALLTLASQAAVAIENARLYEQAGRVSVLEERHRIGMDLHDGTIQALYGLGLLIEDAADRLSSEPTEAKSELRRALDRLNATIADLRNYVLGLRPVVGGDRRLSESLPAVGAQVGANALLDVDVDVSAEAEAALDQRRREAVFYIAADALANIARHARARRAALRLFREDAAVVLEVRDDGVGFDATQPSSGHGLRNMRDRAFSVGGRLLLKSTPGLGAELRLELPVVASELS